MDYNLSYPQKLLLDQSPCDYTSIIQWRCLIRVFPQAYMAITERYTSRLC